MNARCRCWPLLLALVAAACGEVSTISLDATASDAGPDEPEVGTVTLDMQNPIGGEGGPVAGADVLVLQQDGTVVAETTTDDEGLASIDDVPAGSIILVAVDGGGLSENGTIAIYDVQPGDEIRFRGDPSNGASLGQMSVELPAHPDTPPSYTVASGCGASGSGATSIPLSFEEACVMGAEQEADVLAWAKDIDGVVLGFIDDRRPFMADMSMDLTGLDWAAPQVIPLAIDDIPSEAGNITVRSEQVLGRRTYGNIVDIQDMPTDGTEFDVQIPRPAGFGDATLVDMVFGANQDGLGEQQIAMTVTPAIDEVNVSLAEELLPWYAGAVYSAEDRTITWSSTSGRAPDAHYIIFAWEEESDGTDGVWFTVSPSDWTELKLPPLPDDWENRQPSEPGAILAAVFAAESSEVDGWDAARQQGFALIQDEAITAAAPGATLRRSFGAGANF